MDWEYIAAIFAQDIEFTHASREEMFGKLPSTDASEIPKVISSLKELIVKTLELTIIFPTIENQIRAPFDPTPISNPI